jgi:5-methylcytosine-specific restriction protein A
MERRRALSKAAQERVIANQAGLCAACDCDLAQEPVEFDHVLPLSLGGTNDETNFEALHRSCHKEKTRGDKSRIAKADRQRKAHETGRGRARKGPRLQTKPFSRWRSMSGKIVERKP